MAPAIMPNAARRTSPAPVVASVISRPPRATAGAAVNSPASFFGSLNSAMTAKVTTSRPPRHHAEAKNGKLVENLTHVLPG
jgi:hypothetical protein